jgi:hypothetical protein
MITIFKNIKETSAPFYKDVEFVFNRIKEGKYADLISKIRSEENKTERNELKKGLPAICFSGRFKKRADDAIIEHSGLICLDFDGYENSDLMHEDKHLMTENPYVMAAFVSPSGNGLKVIIKIPSEPENHKRYFDALQEHFNSEYFDVTSKNISRVCYESSDPEIYINMDSEVWTTLSEIDSKPIDKYDVAYTIPIRDENVIIDRLMKWWEKKYGLVSGQRNANVFILAAAFNEFGIDKTLATSIIGQFQSSDFTLREIITTVDSAYKDASKFGTKFYEDETELHRIKKKINRGASSKEIKKDLRKLDIDEGYIDDIYRNIEDNSSLDKFWSMSDKGKVNIIHFMFKEFLEQNGFYKFAPHGSDKYMFVRVTNNLIDKASEEEIKDFTLSHLMQFDDLSVYNFFADKTRFFKEDFLSMIDTVNIHFVEDTKDESYIYFRNCALKVTKENIEPIDYVDLGGFVWRDQVIDRDWNEIDNTDCDFKKFISNISGGDESRIRSLESTIGFLMSGYKDPGFCPSVILNDEVISHNPQGGTGKGLFVQGVAALKKVAYIDGKTFSFDKSFAYQTVTTDTQVMCFDDVKASFGFERLFSVITEGLTIEKKNRDAINIPFKYSPKIVITTNYAIKGEGNSFERRKWELEFKQYYYKEFTPVDEFGKRFFDEWTEDEWRVFDNYMIRNLQFYLIEGLVSSSFINLEIRKLASKTCHPFIEWCGLVEGNKGSILLVKDKKIFKDDLYNDFIMDNPDYAPKAKNTISRTQFYRWLDSYGNYLTDCDTVDGRDGNGRWIMFKTDAVEEPQQEEEMFEF